MFTMYTLATIENAKKLVLSKFPNLNMDAMSIEEVVNLAQTLDPSFTPCKVLYACEKADEALGNGVTEALKVAVKEDRRIGFGRDRQSFISFMESDLRGDENAILIAKYMKILMVEYKKTSYEALFVLFNLNRTYSGAQMAVHSKGGWGKFIYSLVAQCYGPRYNGTIQILNHDESGWIRVNTMGHAENSFTKFITRETARNAHNLVNIKEILTSMSL